MGTLCMGFFKVVHEIQERSMLFIYHYVPFNIVEYILHTNTTTQTQGLIQDTTSEEELVAFIVS